MTLSAAIDSMLHRLRAFAPAERLALAGAALVLALQAAGAGGALEYRRSLVWQEPWRLLGAHLVHVNARHAFVNAAAWFVVARVFAPEMGVRRQLLIAGVGAAAISAALWAGYPEIEWYRGLSGVLHALFLAGATLWLARAWRRPDRPPAAAPAPVAGSPVRHLRRAAVPAALFAGAWLKIVLEQRAPGSIVSGGWLGLDVVTPAHLVGGVVGTAWGIAAALRRRGGRP
ncbi:MAG TPA: rhombosortase [Burkholderiaceae bacterium]